MLDRRNYHVDACLGPTLRSTQRYAASMDTGVGYSSIRCSDLTYGLEKLIKPLKGSTKILEAKNRLLKTAVTINLATKLGSQSEMLIFYVANRLATSVILGCDLCDKHLESICPRKRLVELDAGTTVPIIRKPNKGLLDAEPLPEEQEYILAKGMPQEYTW